MIILSISLADSGWSVENVTTEKTTISGDQSTVQCSSTHLTSFAVLVDVRGVKVNKNMLNCTEKHVALLMQIESKELSVVSYIGLSVSIICLVLTTIFLLCQ